MCKSGGSKLHKFVSNSKDVIRRIPESDKTDGVKKLALDLDSLPLERALGVQWCIESDCFQFNIVLQEKPCTRRGILSTIREGSTGSIRKDPLHFSHGKIEGCPPQTCNRTETATHRRCLFCED